MADGGSNIGNANEIAERINLKLRRELGPEIVGFLSDPEVVEVMLNDDGHVWVERLGRPMERVSRMAASQAEMLMGTVASTLKTTITRENPILECELPLDGSRFEALLPPVVRAPVFTIRRKASQVFTLNDYVAKCIMTDAQRSAIEAEINPIEGAQHKGNILVVGGTGSGKTTLTNAILEAMARLTPEDRIVIIEDTAELQCSASNKVILRATADTSMLKLLKATMRLRPDRIVVGEVRGGEALALLKAWNTGHPGGAATVHANNGRAGLLRLESLVAEASSSPMQKTIAEAINLVVVIGKSPVGRRVREVLRVDDWRNGEYVTTPIKD